LGGWFATDFGADGWRLAFNINLPIGAIIIAGLLFFVAESKVASAAKGIDLLGALLSVVMFSTLVFGLIEGRTYGWFTVDAGHHFSIFGFNWAGDGLSVIPVALLTALVSGTIFVLWERARAKQGSQVLLDLNLFKIASFRNGSLAALIISLGEFGILFALPLWFQNVQHLSAVESGLVLLWLAGGAFLASGAGGAMSGKVAPAVAVRIGVLLELLGVIGTAFAVGADAGWGWVAPCLFVYGIGVGFATAQLTGVIMVDVPNELAGQGSGSQSTVRQIGSALGIAVLGTVLFSATQLSLESKLEDIHVTGAAKTAIVNKVVDSSGGAIQGIPGILVANGGNPADAPAAIKQPMTLLATVLVGQRSQPASFWLAVWHLPSTLARANTVKRQTPKRFKAKAQDASSLGPLLLVRNLKLVATFRVKFSFVNDTKQPRSLFLGKKLSNRSLEGELLPKYIALPIFSSDPLSSVAYGPQELIMILTLGGLALVAAPYIAGVVALLLAVIVLSYRRVIGAYPSGGGDYEVAQKT